MSAQLVTLAPTRCDLSAYHIVTVLFLVLLSWFGSGLWLCVPALLQLLWLEVVFLVVAFMIAVMLLWF